MAIDQYSFVDSNQQYFWIAQKISELTKTSSACEIAVLARKNQDLEELIPYLVEQKIPYFFEKYSNVLETDEVRQLLLLLKFINSVNVVGSSSDFYLPEILSAEFLQIPAIDIWLLSTYCNSQKISWLQGMLASEQIEISSLKISNCKKLIHLALAFLELKKLSSEKLALEIIDILLGNVDLELGVNSQKILWNSGFENFYFEQKKSIENYQELLTNLQTLLDVVKQNTTAKNLNLADLLATIEVLEKNHLRIGSKSVTGISENCVNLLTAHKAKGMEFETVFILNCSENNWLKNQNVSKLSFPKNLDLAAQKDQIDDKLRLLYVAITRSKTNLFLTFAKFTKLAKENLPIGFLPDSWVEKKLEASEQIQALEINSSLVKAFKLEVDEQNFLQTLVQDYKLSVTHLLNYIDVASGGPEKFLQNNLLRFPSLKNPKNSYGSATHAALKRFQLEFRQTGILPSQDFLLQVFEKELVNQIFNPTDYQKFLDKGLADLANFYEQRSHNFELDDLVEFDFKNQNVVLGSSQLTGQLDKLRVDKENREILVFDYKSSKPLEKGKMSDEFSKTRLYKYQIQIGFYKFLVENSKDFGGKFEVNSGIIEFLESNNFGKFLDYQIALESEFVANLEVLIQVVYQKIINLDFVDISGYSQDYKGMQEFAADLVAGRV